MKGAGDCCAVMAMQTACTMCPTNSHNLLVDFLASTDVNFKADAYKLDSAEKCICLPGYYGSATSASGCRACPLGGFCCACDRAGHMDGANASQLQQSDCPCIAGVALPVALEERTFPPYPPGLPWSVPCVLLTCFRAARSVPYLRLGVMV
jgi:hypothetical protein